MFDQNAMQQNPYMNNGMGMGGMYAPGYQYQGINPQMVKQMNYLSPEEIAELQESQNVFSLGLTQRESLQAACNHRVADGSKDSLIYDANTGEATCQICGYKFRPVSADESIDDIKDAADRLVDILQTIKIMYADLPQQAAREYFQIIPLINKIPELFQYAARNYNKHELNAWQYNNRNMGAMAMLNNLSAIFGGVGMGNSQFTGAQAAPQYGMPNPAFAGPAPAYAGAPGAFAGAPNPFGYAGASAPMAPPASAGYQPQTTGFSYAPTAPVQQPAPQAPAAPAASDTATVTTQVQV